MDVSDKIASARALTAVRRCCEIQTEDNNSQTTSGMLCNDGAIKTELVLKSRKAEDY